MKKLSTYKAEIIKTQKKELDLQEEMKVKYINPIWDDITKLQEITQAIEATSVHIAELNKIWSVLHDGT
jgi:hypothetical protein